MTDGYKAFGYKSSDEILADMEALSAVIPFDDNVSVLKESVGIGGKKLKNRMLINPMEGCDSAEDGSPTDLVYRRYERFAGGGSALLWVEACAVCREGRANPHQMHINAENTEEFKRLVEHIKKSAEGDVYTVLQLTHSGRYAKPGGGLPAVIAYQNAHLDRFLPENVRIITDDEAEALEEKYVNAALCAQAAGFDAVDVKCCHRYLLSEFLSAYSRDGKYGGSLENRTRLLFNIIKKIKAATSLDIAVRLSAYDEIPYPDGFGADKNDFHRVDLTETKAVVKSLEKLGVKLINVTGGNPYYNPHVNRPYDIGPYLPVHNQLNYIYKLLNAAREIKATAPGVIVSASGFTWLREYAANFAAGCINEGWFDMAGFGRQAFAYPDFARDIIEKGKMERKRCCITCSKCTEMMRDKTVAGCAVRDSAVYLPIYKKGREGKLSASSTEIREYLKE